MPSTKSEDKTVRVFTSNCGIQDHDVIYQAMDLCDNYGLDTIAVGKTIATGMKLCQQGFIKPDDLEGVPLEFGNANGLLEWVRKIAYGEGLGAIMALGSKHLADTFGAVKLSMTAKKEKRSASNAGGSHDQDSELTTVIDSAGLCLFSSSALELSDYTELVNAVTGFNYTDEEMLTCGERILNNEQLYNSRGENRYAL
ncbi:aldehyde ferredoxin oxidoreductase C-terminal domain-containing protein [Desulfitobacterium sp.]|uniref:aldehyde ferredoxin oxidoreductase C-terminal domain-containing protein n=1 Tax=Desulfitobacterium sp. TaxID=49981 RepID=UPI002BE50451|nr:aldehyde ferredoxin oxidoreductase C-terminal domain-containing protein [Desulfitobacterium sp.]HVJ49454.1 aldehyde ferredoxin oxidoreductase C-terminal domain-containing protein [Desulfitobacterium sp.]